MHYTYTYTFWKSRILWYLKVNVLILTGWNPGQFSNESSSTKGKYQCMTLSNMYRHQSGQIGLVDFYYFDSAPCKPNRKERTFYICETPRKPSLSHSLRASDEGNHKRNHSCTWKQKMDFIAPQRYFGLVYRELSIICNICLRSKKINIEDWPWYKK